METIGRVYNTLDLSYDHCAHCAQCKRCSRSHPYCHSCSHFYSYSCCSFCSCYFCCSQTHALVPSVHAALRYYSYCSCYSSHSSPTGTPMIYSHYSPQTLHHPHTCPTPDFIHLLLLRRRLLLLTSPPQKPDLPKNAVITHAEANSEIQGLGFRNLGFRMKAFCLAPLFPGKHRAAEKGFGAHYTIIMIRNPQTSIY